MPTIAVANVSPAIKVNHIGYRPQDPKIAVITRDPGPRVEVRDAGTGKVALTVTRGGIAARGFDEQAGDEVWTADFSSLTRPGSYFLRVPRMGDSYPFEVRPDAYAPLTRLLWRAMYFQRCGTPHPAAYLGADWADPAPCHTGDARCARNTFDQKGGEDYGPLDLSGGWHDAGDYNKYIGDGGPFHGDGGHAIWLMGLAYEMNPSAFSDGQFGTPESGNGVPDILDEMRWGLDWYMRMQRPDGSVLSVVHARHGVYTSGSPASRDATVRYYTDANPGSTAIAGACLALGARIWRRWDAEYAARLAGCAGRAWDRLQSMEPGPEGLWFAAELFRLDPAGKRAAAALRRLESGAAWDDPRDMYGEESNWGGTKWGFPMHRAMAALLRTPGVPPRVEAGIRAMYGKLVDGAFAHAGPYGSGLRAWEYYWSSNLVKASYGLNLLLASSAGIAGAGYTPERINGQALRFLDYLCGVNALNMLYASNTASIGGEHCVWRVYHSWFPFSPKGGTPWYGIRSTPPVPAEPDYPYYRGTDPLGVSDDVTSLYGPFPGLVPDGPNQNYPEAGCAGVNPPMNEKYPHRKYRDWSFVDRNGNVSCSWQVNETGIYYISGFAALASTFSNPER